MTTKFPNEFLVKVRVLLNKYTDIGELNEFLKEKTGIIEFFKSPDELKEFKQFLKDFHIINEANKDLGDFQTPSHLTDKICKYLVDIGFVPDAIVEPTCGDGNFVISAIKVFVKEVSKGQLRSLNVGNDKYTFTTRVQNEVILVCKSPLEVKDKKIQKITKIIADIFDDMFSLEDINNWDGDVSFFDKFKDKVDLYFKMADL